MTEQMTTPTIEELRQLNRDMRQMLSDYFKQAKVHPAVAAILLANAIGELFHQYADPENAEHNLAAILKMVRTRSEGRQSANLH
ncbi:MAG: hypothetical protein ABFS45_19805 [Pseudomonadota bacterium]